MTRTWRMLVSTMAFGPAILCLVSAAAQPPRGKDDKKKEPPREAPAKPDPAVDAWVKTLTDKLADKNPAVRDSARAALVAVGPAAVPALKKLSEGKDEVAEAAKRALTQIENTPTRESGERRFSGRFDPFQGRPGPGDGFRGFGGGLFDRLSKDLELTDKQKDKVKDIVTAHEKKIREAFEKANDRGRFDFEKVRETMKTMREDLVKNLKGHLTEEQFKKLEKSLESGPPGFFPGRGGPGGPGRPGEGRPGEGRPGEGKPGEGKPGEGRPGPDNPMLLTPKLNALELTDKQKGKVKDIAERYDSKVRDLLDKAMKAKERPDFAAIGKLLAETMKELKGVLTDEQFQKLERSMTRPGFSAPNLFGD